MRRRSFLATVAGSAAVSGCLNSDPSTAYSGESGPVTVETLDAPGSEAGTVTFPPAEAPLVLEFFATTCDVCADQMSVLSRARERSDSSIGFLSVTSQPVGLSVSRADVREWWRAHDGDWTVGLDDGTALAERYDASRVPTTLVLDSDGRVAWRDTGRFDAERLVTAVEGVSD